MIDCLDEGRGGGFFGSKFEDLFICLRLSCFDCINFSSESKSESKSEFESRFNDRVGNDLCSIGLVRRHSAWVSSLADKFQGVVKMGFKTDLSPQSGQSLLLGMCVDVGANHKGNDVEKGDPCMFRQELLGKGQCQR